MHKPPTGLRKTEQAAWWLAVCLLAGVWGVGQVWRDAHLATALCFYLPSPVAGLAFMLAGYWAFARKWPKSMKSAAVCAVAVLLFTFLAENRWAPSKHKGGGAGESIRIIHWNIGRGMTPQDQLAKVMKPWQAEIAVLSEVPRDWPLEDWEFLQGGPCDQVRVMSMVVFAEDVSLTGEFWKDGAEAGLVQCTVKGRRARIMVVDLPSDILESRSPHLAWVLDLMQTHTPDLVLGDFNTPRRSRWLSNLEPVYEHAYDQAGLGWSYTWPAPLPVFALDQCITRKPWAASQYRLVNTLASDHCMQVVDLVTTVPATTAPVTAVPVTTAE